jgi:glycosyltransferase involved in cell wall biosynthesis
VSGTTGNPWVSVVIPAYDEERRLPASLEAVNRFLDSLPYASEVIVADDGSVDGTIRVALEAAGKWSRTRVLRLPHKGKGHAVKQGMLAARGAYRLMCDADLSVPIEDLPGFLPPQAQGDVVIGSREAQGAQRLDEPVLRHIMGRIFNRVVATITGLPFADTQCGFKVFTGAAAQRLFSQQIIEGFGFDVELLFLARRYHYRVVEKPVVWKYGTESRVKPVRHSLAMVREAVTVRINGWRGRYR